MHVRVSVSVILALSLAGATAAAQQPSAKTVAEAKKLFLEGKAKFGEQKYVEALAAFQGSLNLVSRHSTILFLGHCYRMLNWPDMANARYQEFLTMVEGDRRLKAKVQASVVEDVGNLAGTLKATLDRVEEGKRQLEGGAAREALATFQQALKQTPWAEIQRQIARCHQKLGEPQKALGAVQLAIDAYEGHVSEWKAARPGSEPPNSAEIQRALAVLTGMKRTLEAEAARGQVRLRGIPDGGSVLVDGERQATAPLSKPLELSVGEHRIEVEAKGFFSWSREVDVLPGREITVAVALQPKPKPRPRKRSTAWLATTFTMGALALGSEIMAWGTWGKSTTLRSTDSSFGTMKSLTVLGHVLAAAFALATGASYFFYERSGGEGSSARTAGATAPAGEALPHRATWSASQF